MRRVVLHPAAPVLGVALCGLVYLVAAPATADMAAHTFRTWLFERGGATVWNPQWYGGHHVLGYSLLFAPTAALVGPALAGVLAAVAATAAFAPLARSFAPADPVRAAAATWLFAAGVLANVVIGRMPFTLGIAFAVVAWLCAERARQRRLWGPVAGLASLAGVWASPVAGAYLLLAAVARVAGGGRRELGPAAWLAVPALAGGAALVLLFPEGGPDRFVASAFWPMLAISVLGAALLAPGHPRLRAGAVLYVLVLVAAFVVQTPFGQNALRLGVLVGPPLLVLAAHPKAPRLALAACGVVLLYLQWLPAVRAIGESQGDPSTRASFYTEARAFLDRSTRPGERVEVAFTRNHWEAAHLATAVPLARGWERQLDQKVNPLFYDDARFTTERYEAWLKENAVRWVALPAAPLDYSARAEARLLERGAAFLRPAYRSPEWRIWEVRDPGAPASGRARMVSAGPEGFEVVTDGRTIVRQRYTRYWRADGGACLSRAPGGWTEVSPEGTSIVRVRARFTLPLGKRGGDCGDAPVERAERSR
jgi:hypothetical protein